jgi:hypothetical protein
MVILIIIKTTKGRIMNYLNQIHHYAATAGIDAGNQIRHYATIAGIDTDITEKVKKAFLIGFGVSIINAKLNDLRSPAPYTPSLKIGALWATATLLYGVAGPLFRRFNNPARPNHQRSMPAELVRGSLAIAGAATLARFVGMNVGRTAIQNSIVLFVVSTFVQDYKYPSNHTRIFAPRV